MKYWILILSIFLTVGCATKAQKGYCALPQPTILKNEGEVLFQYWDLNAAELQSLLLSPPDINDLKTYRSVLESKYNINAKALLKNSLKSEADGDKKNIQLVLSNPNSIRKMNCLESKLLSLQNSRKDLLKEPTEFIAFLLSKDDKRRIFYFTSNIAGVRSLGYIHSQLEHLIKDEWNLDFNLHNHNFFINKEKYNGVTAPSVTDAWLYQMEQKDFNLKKAIITNGFDSAEITSNLFEKLATKN